jgi:hypothetical protein
VTFDHRLDSGGRDSDLFSPQLRRHHQILWSKPLPSGETFELTMQPKRYLVFRHDDPVYSLSSDSISNSYRNAARLKDITSQISNDELDLFQALGSTVGAKILFPGKRINRKPTINVARGWNRSIGDRFDLTLECIRLQYLKKPNPLQVTLATYWKFFELFQTFEQYVEFFLLDDLIADGKVRFFIPTDSFDQQAFPETVASYNEYMANSMDFVMARNLRILEWVKIQSYSSST